MWWSVGQSWIPANPSLPSVWRTKKSIQRKLIRFGFSGLFDFVFLCCPNKLNSLFSLLSHHEDCLYVQAWHRADIWCTESLSRREGRKIGKAEWWLIAGLHQSVMVHGSCIFVLWGYREVKWSEGVLVTKKVACHPEVLSRYLTCCRLLVCRAELFADLIGCDDSPALVLNGTVFQFLGSTVIPRLTKIIRSGITFVSRNLR